MDAYHNEKVIVRLLKTNTNIPFI